MKITLDRPVAAKDTPSRTPTGGRIFFNGNIHTLNDAMPKASVLAVRNGRIIYAGDDIAEAAAAGPGAERTDLGGLAVIPGLADSHQHFMMEGLHLTELDVHCKPREAIVRAVAARAKTLKPGEWILGRGWNHDVWPTREWPCKEDLDAVAPENPVALTRLDGHSMWVNSLALRLAGLDRNSPDYAGGEILRTADGDLRGILIDTPIFRVRSIIPAPSEERKREACLKAQAEMFGFGITSVGDAWQMPPDHELLKNLYESGDLRIRIYGMLASRIREDGASSGPGGIPVTGLFDERLSLRAYKVVLDGSLGSRSAHLSEDYADRPGHRGNNRYTDEELLSLLRTAANGGFQLCIHAIGDAAVLQAVTALEALRREAAGPWLRHRIEHFQTASGETVNRALALGVIPAMQTLHAAADKAMAESRLPLSLLAQSYPWRTVLDGGGIIANGSDSPMDGVNPFHGFHAAVARTAFAKLPQDSRLVRMTREEALKSYTLWAAEAELAGKSKGSLSPGKAADFVVLDRDIMTCPLDDARETKALMTVLAGETVYGGV